MTMTPERLAELDAAIARFPVSLPWYSCATSRNGVTGIHGEPHGEPPHQGVAYLADVFGDAAPVVEAMNSLPDLRAHIDALAATIVRLREALQVIVDDYQTSPKHHPNDILIPIASFGLARAALTGAA